MYKIVKGIVIGGVIGLAIGMIDFDEMSCIAKKCIRKGKRLIRNVI